MLLVCPYSKYIWFWNYGLKLDNNKIKIKWIGATLYIIPKTASPYQMKMDHNVNSYSLVYFKHRCEIIFQTAKIGKSKIFVEHYPYLNTIIFNQIFSDPNWSYHHTHSAYAFVCPTQPTSNLIFPYHLSHKFLFLCWLYYESWLRKAYCCRDLNRLQQIIRGGWVYMYIDYN